MSGNAHVIDVRPFAQRKLARFVARGARAHSPAVVMIRDAASPLNAFAAILIESTIFT